MAIHLIIVLCDAHTHICFYAYPSHVPVGGQCIR
jgi:hypothetical protein